MEALKWAASLVKPGDELHVVNVVRPTPTLESLQGMDEVSDAVGQSLGLASIYVWRCSWPTCGRVSGRGNEQALKALVSNDQFIPAPCVRYCEPCLGDAAWPTCIRPPGCLGQGGATSKVLKVLGSNYHFMQENCVR